MEKVNEVLAKQSEAVLSEAYKDLLKPSTQPMGQILSYLPRTIRLALNRWEKWIINGEESIELTANLLKEKLQEIPEEKICEPEPYVAIPAIQQLSYCENSNILRELYANLLASSMNLDTKWSVHPSFVDIIKQLTPDEAKLLKTLPPNIIINHPLINVRLIYKGDSEKTGFTHIANFTTFGLNSIENKGQICAYIDNLVRLKLIEIPFGRILADNSHYDELKENPILKKSIDEILLKSEYDLDYEYHLFHITNFGINFVSTCCM